MKLKNIFIKLGSIIFIMVRKDIRIKTIIFVIGIIIWFSISLEKEFEIITNIPLKMTGLDSKLTFLTPIKKEARVRLKGKGKVFLLEDLQNSLYINVNLNGINKDQSIEVLEENLINLSTSQITLKRIYSPKTIDIFLDRVMEKEVPVKVNYNFDVAPGYIISGKSTLFPSKIKLKGPKSIVKNIDEVRTISQGDTIMKNSIDIEIPLLLPHKEVVQYSQDHIKYKQKVVKKGSMEFKKMINLKNAKPEDNILITPLIIKMKITAPVDVLQTIDPDTIKISADYKKLNQQNKTIPLKIESNFKYKLELSTNKVKVLN